MSAILDGTAATLSSLLGDKRGRKIVCVQGLGFVGAANAIAIAAARDGAGEPLYNVIGVDLPTDSGRERAAALNQGKFPFATTDAALVTAAGSARRAGNLVAVTDASAFGAADIIVVEIGLDIEDETPKVDLPPFRAAIGTVGDHMKADALVLLESTVPPGTTERIVAPLLRERLAARSLPTQALKLAYCYERVMPGDGYLASIVDMWRVYAGMTVEAADAAEAFLSSFIDTKKRPLTRLESIRAVETAKVLENTFRAVNIALIDEWEKFARRIDVDLFEVLKAIRVRPTHQNIRYPGLGVGGNCLSKDPMFGTTAAQDLFGLVGFDFPLSTAAVAINSRMPAATVALLEEMIPGGLAGKHVLILGASYREDVGDTRHSPSLTLAGMLIGKRATVAFADPLVEGEIGVPLHRELPDAHGFDAVILAVGHKPYRAIDLAAWSGAERPVVLDANGVLSRQQLQSLRDAGFEVAAIGRGLLR
ncbi:MAG TPA: nucleotide sugar dehydrogenase [Xanthobacteraceae bacterium]|nr:nucleotide sugar dehydrogenase [Xanthobacteraceae bacterium]